MKKLVMELLELKEKKGELYDIEPVDLLSEDELLSIIHMKFFRIRHGLSLRKCIDDLKDMIIYSLILLERWYGIEEDMEANQ